MNNNTTPLSPMQKAYLLGKSEMFPLSCSSMHDFREFHGQIDRAQFENNLIQLIENHAPLRTRIDEASLVQIVLDQVVLTAQFEYIDLQTFSDDEAEQQLDMYRKKYRHYLHLLDTPPWSICLVQLPKHFDSNTVIFTSFDGLILDGYSISVLLNQLFRLDNTHSSMIEHVVSQAEKNTQVQPNEKDRQFWIEKLDRIDNITQLPWRTALEKIKQPHYQRRSISIDGKNWIKLSALAAQHRLLPNALLTTIVLEVLSVWAEDQHLCISMPISNSAISKQVGNHSSFIVLSYEHIEGQSFADKVKVTQKDILESMSHTTFSGVELSKYLIQKTQESIVLPIALTNGLSWQKPEQQHHMHYVAGQTQTPQLALDIRLTFSKQSDLLIDLDYIEEALSGTVIHDMLEALQYRLNEIAQLDDLEQASVQQSHVSSAFDADFKDENYDDIELDNYLEQIEYNLFKHNLNKAALIYDGKIISYRELGENVGKVSVALRQAGVQQGQVVAICLRKSPEHVYAILACALSHIIWLPVDMDSPKARQEYILQNSHATIAISLEPIEGIINLDIGQVLASSQNLAALQWSYRNDGSPAYYLYTSGSTGTPKCVVLNNRSTANVLQQTIASWKINKHDIHLAATPFHHDMAIFDLMAPLSVGGTIVIPTAEQVKSAAAWAQLVEQYQVSIWCTVPAMADMLLTTAESQQLQSIRLINQGGDYVKPSVIQRFREILPNTRLISIGGPTETTIWSIWHEITPQDQDVIPYGKELKYNRYYLLNKYGAFCPDGVTGQMYMSGINLANGYLLDGQITQKDFVQLTLPNGKKKRVFRMSDKGYLREDGNIIFAGRDEGYLKVRGVRIAASEVENALLKHPNISDCVVITCVNPVFEGNELVAIYTGSTSQVKDVSPPQLRQFLQTYVPQSHIPSRWLFIKAFPITRNGKIDRKSLHKYAEDNLYQTYARPEHELVKQPVKHKLEQNVLEVLRQSLMPKQSASDLFLETEILAVGITPKHLNHLAKHFSNQLDSQIDFYGLSKCRTIGELVETIRNQSKQK